ncbi:MAG: hypothetical protein ABR587_14395 [Candidatus Binatia bacterium]
MELRVNRFTAPGSVLFSVLMGTSAVAGVSPPEYLGPTPYTSEADSPFEVDSLGFCIENFEDGVFNIPGATGNSSVFGPAGNADSVDGDDGAIDGSGSAGRSYFSGNGTAGIEITFDAERTYGLPTTVGIVWTDGGGAAPVFFEAFGPDNESILKVPYGPHAHADGSNSGETAEDRFYGITSSQGISRILLSNIGGGIEADHIQLNRCILCGDTNADLRLTAPDALFALRAAVGSETCNKCICDVNSNDDISVSDALAILRTSVGLNVEMNCTACNLMPI